MQLNITGIAPLNILIQNRIISSEVHAENPKEKTRFISSQFLTVRTSQGSRDLLEVLGVDGYNAKTYTIDLYKITEDQWEKIQEIIDISGEPEDVQEIKLLINNSEELFAMVDLMN